nr:13779_t:CDS:2 [Entrophospora candida]
MNQKVEPPIKVRKRMKELITLLENIEDAIYDKHLKELKDLETQYNFIFSNSPTQKAGHSASPKFRSVTRQIPMLSLDSVDNQEDLFRFDERIDGLSISLIYQNHQLIQISTRGNGVVGEEITFNKELIKNIPFTLKEIADCEVRGEVYMKKGEFYRLNKELSKSNNKLLANPRNAAAGSLRTLIPLQDRNLHFFAYQLFNQNIINNAENSLGKLDKQLTCLKKLEKLGFAVSPDYQLFPSIQEA